MECKGQTKGMPGQKLLTKDAVTGHGAQRRDRREHVQKRMTGRHDMVIWQTEATEDIMCRSDSQKRLLPPHTARPILDIGLHNGGL